MVYDARPLSGVEASSQVTVSSKAAAAMRELLYGDVTNLNAMLATRRMLDGGEDMALLPRPTE